jgi:hypothetical protein
MNFIICTFHLILLLNYLLFGKLIVTLGPRRFEAFRNGKNFYGEGLLAPRETHKLEDHPLSAARDCSFNYSQLPSVPGGLPSILNLRMHHAVVTKDPPDMVT